MLETANETEARKKRAAELRATIDWKPPIRLSDLLADTEYDPQGAEHFVALIRELRAEPEPPSKF